VATDLQSRFRLGYRPALDGLRGISILAVMVYHGHVFWLVRGGFLGVDIFFVLSGFLITSLLLEEWTQMRTISVKNFYMRRALRLLPALVKRFSSVRTGKNADSPLAPSEASAYLKEKSTAVLKLFIQD
jgi:hypothetical protein